MTAAPTTASVAGCSGSFCEGAAASAEAGTDPLEAERTADDARLADIAV